MIEQRLSAQIEAFTTRQEVINVDLVETPKLFPGWSRGCFRNASNVSFHALAWTLAVWVNTPSRSRRQASMLGGKPSELRSALTG